MAVPSKYMQSVIDASKGRPKSTAWFRDKIAEFGTPKAMQLIRDGKQASSPFFGNLNISSGSTHREIFKRFLRY